MPDAVWMLAVIIVLAIVVLGVVWLTQRNKAAAGNNRSKSKVIGPFGMSAQVESSNDVAPGIRIHDAQSQAGGLHVEDQTGRGVDISQVMTKKDITISNTPPPPSGPKV